MIAASSSNDDAFLIKAMDISEVHKKGSASIRHHSVVW